MNIPLPKESALSVSWIDKLESMVSTTPEVKDESKPELHPVKTYYMTQQEIHDYFAEKYGKMPDPPPGKKQVGNWNKK